MKRKCVAERTIVQIWEIDLRLRDNYRLPEIFWGYSLQTV